VADDDPAPGQAVGSGGAVTISAAWLIDGAIQSDGKIIAVGGSGGDFFVVRLNTDGTSDTSFNSSGSVQVDFGASEYAMGVALAPDGKIVVTGPTISSGGNGNYGVARLTTSGALDTSFNSTGKETLDLGNYDIPNGLVVQDTGKIVVVGASGGGAMVVRFNASGGVDTTFGSGGTGEVSESGDYGFRMNIESLSDDRLLVAGSDGGNVVLHRYSADGVADDTFGTSGTVTTDMGASDSGFDIGVQPDGKVVVVGQSQSGASNYDAVAIRYDVDGSLDTTFGSGGTMLIWYGSSSYSETDYFESVAIQPDGQIVAVGTANGKFALARMNGGLARLYAQQDANWNITAVDDVSGNVKERFDGTPFGVMTVLSPTWGNTTDGYAWQYTFQGGRYDPATGMIRFGLRDYRPNLGTWMELDPAGYIAGADRYAFATGSPEVYTDPTGLDDSGSTRVHLPGNDWYSLNNNGDFKFRSPNPCTVIIGIKHWGDDEQDVWDVPDNEKFSAFGILACMGDTINQVQDGGRYYGPQRGLIKNFPRIHSMIGAGAYNPGFNNNSFLQNLISENQRKAFNLNNNQGAYNGGFGSGPRGFHQLLDAAWEAAITQAKAFAKKAQGTKDCPCKFINVIVVAFEKKGDPSWDDDYLNLFKRRKVHVDVNDPDNAKLGLGN